MPYSRKKHIPLIIFACLLILIVGGGIVSYSNLTSLSKHAMARLASHTIGTEVQIDSLDIDPENQSVVIKGMTIGNPKGYKRDAAITVGMIDIDASSLKREQLVFEDIKISGMNVRVEVSADGTNLSSLRQQVEALSAASREGASAVEPVKVVVNHIVFAGTRIEPAEVTDAIARHLSPKILPEMHMRGIGEKQGVSAQEAVSQILIHVLNAALRAAADEGYLDSLSPQAQQDIGVRVSVDEKLLENTKAAAGKVSSDVKTLRQNPRTIYKVNE